MNLFQSYKTPTRRKKRNTRRRKQRVTKMRKNTRKYHGIRKTKKRKFGGMTNNGNESEGSNEYLYRLIRRMICRYSFDNLIRLNKIWVMLCI